MAQFVLEIAKDLTLALIKAGSIPPEAMPDTLQKTHATLTALKAQEEAGSTLPLPHDGTPPKPLDWRKSITRHGVTCLACGATFKQLSRRHLQEHELDGRSYRARYGIPPSQPLSAKATTARRREIVQGTRPWEKSPRFIQGQERDGETLPEPEAQAPHDEIEASSAAVLTAPKRERKAATKKKTARKKRSQA